VDKESVDKESVITCVMTEAIGEINGQRGADEQLGLGGEDLLFGGEGPLDSLGLVQLIAELENRLEEQCNQRVNLADEELLGQDESPFASVGALRAYLVGIV
jgi:acyl carrier protein